MSLSFCFTFQLRFCDFPEPIQPSGLVLLVEEVLVEFRLLTFSFFLWAFVDGSVPGKYSSGLQDISPSRFIRDFVRFFVFEDEE